MNFPEFFMRQQMFRHLFQRQTAEDVLADDEIIIQTTLPNQDDYQTEFGFLSREANQREETKEDVYASILQGFSQVLSEASDEFRQLADRQREAKRMPFYLSDEEVEKHIRPLVNALKIGDFKSYLEQINKISQTYVDIKGKPAFAFERASVYEKESKLAEAIVLYHISCKLSLELYAIDRPRLMMMQRSVSKIATWSRAVNLLELKNGCVDVITDVIKDMNGMTKGGQKDCKHMIAWCYKALGFALHYLEKFKEAAEAMNKGIEVLKKEFGDESQEFHVYGLLLSSVAICYMNQGLFDKAQLFFKRAEDALSKATDWPFGNMDRTIQEIKQKAERCRQNKPGEHRSKDLLEIMEEVKLKLTPNMQAKTRKEYDRSFKVIVESVKALNDDSTGAQLILIAGELMKSKQYCTAFSTLHLTCRAILHINRLHADHVQGIKAAAAAMIHTFESHLSNENNKTKMKSFAKEFYFPAFNNVISVVFNRAIAKGHIQTQLLVCAAHCYKFMADIFLAVELDQKSLSCLKDGVNVMERPEIKSLAPKFRIYGVTKHFAAALLANMGNADEARKWALEAKQALQKSQDWENDDLKAECIKGTDMLLAKICLYT